MGLESIRGLLLDLSGTIYVDDTRIEGALEAVKALQAARYRLRYITNTTSRPRRRILQRMEKLGLPVAENEVFTAPLAASHVLEAAGHRRCHFLLNKEVLEEFAAFENDTKHPEAVVIGDIGEDFTYKVLNLAFEHIMEGAAFYALAENRFFKSGGRIRLDMGPFVKALEYATGQTAEVIGKPAPAFFHAAVATMSLETGEVAMVGDDIESDVGGAMQAGLKGILVKTGKYKEEDAARSPVQPDITLDSIAGLPGLLGI
ncbi:TIGR01458 family HAD-type hydrolase [Coraliomargarita parva]|uniref:TIGR01458 family HAD-type hydrolase n=1 Tax=Coraliomargarita parva TaxID=3014050 RepID=UPI0022B5CE7A|nr:TIGR01458 family HAD-type hydrolase [Coraliomargarita parva]